MNIASVAKNVFSNAMDIFDPGDDLTVQRSETLAMDANGLSRLASERRLRTREIHGQNDYYGHATILKLYAGIPMNYAVKAVIEHGIFFGGFAWDCDVNADLPAMLVPARFRFPILRKQTEKKLYAIGPMLAYATQLLSEMNLHAEKQRLGRNLLAFPAHSTHHVESQFDLGAYCRRLEQLGRDFNSVRVCLYWKDVLRGWGAEFSRRGFECVTAGHIFDPLFLPRLKSILECASVTTSNELGTHVGYSTLMGKPHFLSIDDVKRTGPTAEILKRDVADRSGKTDVEEIRRAFSELRSDISEAQLEVANRYWGTGETKSVDQLRGILDETELLYRKVRGPLLRLKDHYRWLARS